MGASLRSSNGKDATILGVILAGGLSSRLGQDKAKLSLDKASPTILERTQAILQQCVEQCIVMTREIQETATVFCDHGPRIGPLGGIARALALAKERQLAGILVLPCDMPFLEEWLLRELLAAYRLAKSLGQDFWQFVWLGEHSLRPENLTAIYLTSALPCVANAIYSQDYALNRLIPKERIKTLVYTAEQARYFYNINTPEDLAQAKSSLALD